MLYYVGFGSCLAILLIGLPNRPETSIKVWAEEESIARRRRIRDFEAALAAAEAAAAKEAAKAGTA